MKKVRAVSGDERDLTEVVKIRRSAHDKFQVTYRDKQAGTITVTEFDAMAICSGAHAVHIPRLPQFEGADTFRGEIQHSVQYRTPEPFRGKHVVCVGFGETAADVAAQIADVAASCWTSFRRYPSVLQRYYDYGTQRHTNDAFATRIQAWLPRFVMNRRLLREAQRTLQAPPDKARPHQRLLAEWTIKCGTPAHQSFQKNDDFVESILAGKLQVKPCGIQRLEEDSVVFTDGSRLMADVLMCCTGYDEGKPPNLIEGVDIAEVRQLYKHVFHPDLRERVAFIGWARPVQGGIPACSEMQSRYFALLCSGKRALPEKNELQRLIAQDREAEERSFYARKSQGTLCSYTPYYDDLAARFALAEAVIARLAQFNILYDRDADGEYFQLYSRAFAKRFFFEIVQRRGYDAYGAANAPIRLAAQSRYKHDPLMPLHTHGSR